MASSVPAQVMYPPPPPPSFGGAHPHNPSHHVSQPSHFTHHPQPSSSSSYHANPQAQSQHHQHHASSLPPPPPSGQHYQGYATQYPSHSHAPPTHHQYTQDRPQERLPSIRDLDFPFHQQQAAQVQSSQNQQQGQHQSSQQQASQQHQQPTGSSSGGGPGAGTSGNGPESTIQPGSLAISPTRQRRHWGASATVSTAGPSQSQSNSHHPSHSQSHQQVHPQALPHSQHSHLVSPATSAPVSSSVSASASASSSFVAPPPMASRQSPQYHTASSASRRPRSESLAGGGSRGSIGSDASLSGAASGPTSGLSGGPSSGGMNPPVTSPVTRSPLTVPPYGHNAASNSGYAPPPTSSMGAASIPTASSMAGAGNAGGPLGSSTTSVTTGKPGAHPHSPYGAAFPSPHSPHLTLHTPLSQAHGPSTSTSGAGTSTGGITSGGTQGYARQEYVQYDYSAGYAPSAGAGPSTGSTGAPPVPGEQHAYAGRGIPQGQILYSGLPPSHPSHHAPPTQEPWPTQPQLHQTHQPPQLATYHAHTQHQPQPQPQHQTYPRSPSGSSSLVGAISGGYGIPLSSHQQAHEHGHMVSPGLPEHDPGSSGHAGGIPLALPGGGAGVPVPGSARAHFLPKIQEQCYVLYDFARRYSNSSVQPSQAEVEHMSRVAADMIALLSEYRRAALVEGAIGAPSLHHPHPYMHPHPYSHAYPGGSGVGLPSPAPEESNRDRMSAGMRAPKRPWEDIAQESDEDAFGPESVSAPPPGSKPIGGLKRESISTGQMLAGIVGRDPEVGKARTAAEKDMDLIRSKRATNVGTLGPGAPKGKYRKRSQRATPPGKCHSCNIRETPEWRRGPDGARTLCNACGLHYAKLIRKRDKQAAASADGLQARIEIDMETLRASTRAASEREQIKAERERERQREREKAAVAVVGGEGVEGKGEDGVQRGSLGLGLETGINGFSSGEDVKENGIPDVIRSVLNERANAISTPVAMGDTSSSVSTGSNGLQESWHPYADADLAQSSFLRGVSAATTVRPASS